MGISTFRSRSAAAAFYTINIVLLYLPPRRRSGASVNPTYCPKITFALRTRSRGKSNSGSTVGRKVFGIAGLTKLHLHSPSLMQFVLFFCISNAQKLSVRWRDLTHGHVQVFANQYS